MAAVSASTSLLLTDPTLRLPESTWVIAAPDAIPIVETTGIVNVTATAMTTVGTGIEETVTVIVPRVATTGTVVIETRIGIGVIGGAPVVPRLIAGGEEATLVARLGGAPDVIVTVINPKILVVFSHRLPVSGMQVIVVFKLSSFETPLSYCIKTSNSSCSVNSLKTCVICQALWNETMFFKCVQQSRFTSLR